METEETDGTIEEKLGLSVIELTPQIARQLSASPDTVGVVINAVDPNSDARRKGLRRGDIILSANYRAVGTIEALREQVDKAAAEDRDAMLLRILRRGQPPRLLPVRLR